MKNSIATLISLSGVLALALTLGACQSADSSVTTQQKTGAPLVSPPPPPVSAADPSGGYLYGELNLDDASNSTYPIQIVMSEDGRFRALQIGPYSYPETRMLLSGSFALDDRLISGEGIAIASPGEAWADGQTVTAISISGTLDRPTYTSQGKLLITVSMSSGDSGTIDAKYAALSGYWYSSSLAQLAGNWGADLGDNGSWYPDPYGNADPPLPPPGYLEFEVTGNGNFVGIDTDGCETAGQFSLIDTRYAVWSVDYTISNCGRAGNYSGLALGDNHWYDWRSLTFSADDGVRSQSLELWKQE